MSETTARNPAGGDATADEQAKPPTGKTPAGKPAGDKTNPANRQGEMNDRLDEALEETFPSSDPVSVKITK